MCNELATLDDWIDGAKHELPQLNAKLRARQSWTDYAGAKALQRQIDLVEGIFEHYRVIPRVDLERSDLHGLLEAIKHVVQHCEQTAVDAQEDKQLTGCLVALTTMDRLMSKLRC